MIVDLGTTVYGSSTRQRRAGMAGLPAGLRPLCAATTFAPAWRNGEFDEGGLEELVEFIPSWRLNPAFSARKVATSARNCSITAA